MEFDAKTGMMKCQGCGKTVKAEELAADNKETADEFFGDYEKFQEETNYHTFAGEDVHQYICKNCGAVVMTEKDTTATRCEFCGSPVVLGDRLSGELSPTNVIPFKITKQEAQEAFRTWCGRGWLIKKEFKEANRLKSLTGMYVPYWLFDVQSQGEVHAHCTRDHTYEQGDYIITETWHYDVFRKVDIAYQRVPADASEKMDDAMMDKLEPFSYRELKKFQTPYLAGYLAEKYNYTDKELFPRVQKRVRGYTKSYIRSTIHGYTTTQMVHENLWERKKKAEYTLFPVWMFCYDYQNCTHNFYMNGQTGKIVGKPPLSKGKIALTFFGLTAISEVLLTLLLMML